MKTAKRRLFKYFRPLRAVFTDIDLIASSQYSLPESSVGGTLPN